MVSVPTEPFDALLTHYLAAEELSEEDQQLKSELDMLVERLTVCVLLQHLIYAYMHVSRRPTKPYTNLLSKLSKTQSKPPLRP